MLKGDYAGKKNLKKTSKQDVKTLGRRIRPRKKELKKEEGGVATQVLGNEQVKIHRGSRAR